MRDDINIIVASENTAVIDRILSLLSYENDLKIIDNVKNENDAIIKTTIIRPDVLILALSQSQGSIPELISILHSRSPSTKIIMFSDMADNRSALKALKDGASAYLLKETDMDILVPVIRIVISGRCYMSNSLIIQAFSSIAIYNYFPGQFINFLNDKTVFSAAERSIIASIAKGQTDNEIAENLNFHVGTVRNYLFSIKRRLNLRTRIQIVIFSIVKGLIKFDSIFEE